MKLSPAEYVIMIFGGVRATAREIGYSPSAISKWRHQGKGNIPNSVKLLIYNIAQNKGYDITAEDLLIGRDVSFGKEVVIYGKD